MVGALLALTLDAADLRLTVETDRIDGLYAAGETATVSVAAKDKSGALAKSGRVDVKVDNFGSVVVTNLTADFAVANPFSFRVTRPDAGFLRVNAGGQLCGVGFDARNIAPGTPNPADFASFWRDAIAKYDREIPSQPEVRVDEALSDKDWIVERVAFAAPGGRTVYGFVSRERKAAGRLPGRVEIAAAGYGSWSQGPSKDRGRITLKMTVYPFEPDPKLGRKADYEAGNTNAWKRWGVPRYCHGGISESREAFFFYPVILANNRAIDWFAARSDVDATKIDYKGTSQGGGLGLAAMALNKHFARGCVFVPALTDVMGSKAGNRQSGWPKLVESHPAAVRATVERNAPYFCGVNFARMITIPIRFVVGHVDTTCPPNAVYSAYNVCPSADKAICGGIGMGHGVFGDYCSYMDAWSRGCEIERPQVRFLAFNIWGDYFGNPVPERAPGIIALVRRWDPDLAGFQEMTPRFWSSALVAELEKDYAFVGRGIGVDGHDVHTPVLYRRTRFDLIESGIILQCPELDESKGAVWAVLKDKTTGKKLVAFASHAWWRYDGAGDDWIRLNGAKMLAEKMQELAKRHDAAVVGGGDLNAPVESGSLKWLLSHGYADAQASAEISPRGFPTEHGDPKRGPDGTYVGRNAANGHSRVPEKFRYLDHIFFDPTRVAARRFDIDISPAACRVSDHHPIVLDFDFADPAPRAGGARPWNPTNEWPFAIVRSYGPLAENEGFTKELIAAQIRHPGLVDEIWDESASLVGSDEACARSISASDALAAELARLGIARAYQQGFTFGHEGNLQDYPGFTDADWTVTSDGHVQKNVFCPLSPVAEKANRRQVERVLRQMKPVSYWPDDDLRYSKFGDRICFCARCLAAFNAKTGANWTRESLVQALYGVPGDKAVREAWIAFHAENLGRFARIYREAVDKYLPSCRLGIQLVQSYADYNGRDFRPLLEALAGPERKKVGIRPGACFYEDRQPRDMFRKALYVMNESARTKSYGLVGQICYEAENWPHVAAAKNPVTQMVECSLALAAGCDSLALYWGADRDRLHREEPATHANYFETFAKWKPFLLAIRDACRGTEPCGLAEFRGSDEKATGDWCWRDDKTEVRLMENALPISVPDARVEARWLSARRVAALATNDLSVLFARTVLADEGAVRALRSRFSGHPAFAKIGLPSESEACAATRTDFGGTVVVAHDLAVKCLWSGPDRAKILDALDAAIPGRAAARILTGGFCVTPIVRTDAAGRVKGVYILNASPGETAPLAFSVRRPAGTRVCVRTVDGTRDPLEMRRAGETLEIVIPPLAGWRPVWIELTGNRTM